jgi:hypothetical protein
MKFFKSIFSAFTIWVLAALLNALISATWMSLFATEFNRWPVWFFLSVAFTLFFSVPGVFIFWLVLLANWQKPLLFQTLLKAGLIISSLSSLFLFVLNDHEIEGQQFAQSLSIIISSIASIMMHFPILKNIPSNKIANDYASINQ